MSVRLTIELDIYKRPEARAACARLAFVVAVAACCAGSVSAQSVVRPQAAAVTAACTPSLEAGSHPRGFVNVCDMPTQLIKLTGSTYRALTQATVNELESNWATVDAGGCSHYTCPHFEFNYALAWYLHDSLTGIKFSHTRAQYGAKAKSLLDYHRTTTVIIYNYDSWKIAAALDLLWGYLDATQQGQIVTWFKTQLDSTCSRYGNDPPNAVGNSQVPACWAGQTVMGVVALNEGMEASWVNAKYSKYAEKFRQSTGVTNFESFFQGRTGAEPYEGTSYGHGYTIDNVWPVEEFWRLAHGIARATHYDTPTANFLHAFPRAMTGFVLPWKEGGRMPRALFSAYRAQPRYPASSQELVNAIQAFQGAYAGVDDTGAKLARWVQLNMIGEIASGAATARHGFTYILMGPSTYQTAQSSGMQGLATHWRAGTNRYFFRTDFTSSDGCWATLEAQKWIHIDTIRPRNPGGIAMFCNGLNSLYVGDESNTYTTQSRMAWGGGMCFPDRTIDGPTAPSTGRDTEGCGRRNINNITSTNDFTTGSAQDMLAELRDSLASGSRTISYVGQDLVRAYDSTTTSDKPINRDRISAYWEDVAVAFRPGRMLVWQHHRVTTTSMDFVPTLLVFLPNAGTINGQSSAGPVRKPKTCPTYLGAEQCAGAGETLGHATFAGTTAINAKETSNGASAAFWNTIGLPSSARVIRVGGPNTVGTSYTTNGGYSLEATDLYGVRYPQTSLSGGAVQKNYMPPYRAEITQTTTSTAETFFLAQEMANNSAASQSATTFFTSGSGFNCASIANALMCFGSDGASKTGGTAVITQNGTFEAGWCGLAKGTTRTFTPSNGNINLNGAGPGNAASVNADSAGCVWFASFVTTSTGGTITVS